jgi:hypothetical protein
VEVLFGLISQLRHAPSYLRHGATTWGLCALRGRSCAAAQLSERAAPGSKFLRHGATCFNNFHFVLDSIPCLTCNHNLGT